MKAVRLLIISVLSLSLLSCLELKHDEHIIIKSVKFIILSFIPSWEWKRDEPYYELPFSVQYVGSRIEMELPITETRYYAFALGFKSKEGDYVERERMWKLAGDGGYDKTGKYIDNGIPIFLKLKIVPINKQKQIVLDKEISELRTISHNSTTITKEITRIELDPGRYRVIVENQKDIPEMNGADIRFLIMRARIGK